MTQQLWTFSAAICCLSHSSYWQPQKEIVDLTSSLVMYGMYGQVHIPVMLDETRFAKHTL